jgi:sodium-dependent dicarboxylate transporter 2/3/5
MRNTQRIGLFVGPVVFLLMLLLPAPGDLSLIGWRTAAAAALIAIWWMTEAIPIPATALLPLVLFPVLGILSAPDAAAPYANELIFLFMGGFFIAFTMERWGLHKRIALTIMGWVGTSPSRLILGFMIATAFLSMWISNTATAAMMLPIALAVAELFRPQDTEGPYEFGIALMLGIAYAASIGGVSTLIGTPPNAVFAGAVDELLNTQIGFGSWMMIGLPVTIVMLPIAWFMLTKVLFKPGALTGDADAILAAERVKLGRMGRGERMIAVVFAITVFCWIFRQPKDLGGFTIPGLATFAPGIRDSTIAIAASVVLFALPVNWKKGEFVLDWPTARRIPWGVLVLFGGGLSLARGMDRSGLASWIGNGVANLEGVPTWVLLAAVATLFIFLTELTSNVATCTMAMPIMVGVAEAIGVAAIPLMATAAMAASMAFMLPVATPPNAIVFGSGYLTIPQMARAGFWLNVVSIVVVTIAGSFLVPMFLPPN